MFLLLRKKPKETEWRSSTKGELEYILTVLRLNLTSPSLKDLEWKIQPIK